MIGETDEELDALTDSLEVYGKEKEPSKWQKFKGKVIETWNKTIFSDMLKEKQENKRLQLEIRKEARQQAVTQLKGDLQQKYIQEEKDKIMGVKKPNNAWEKLARGFGAQTQQPQSNQPKTNKFVEALSIGRGSNSIISDDKIRSLMTIGTKKPEKKVIEVKYRSRKKKKKKIKQKIQVKPNIVKTDNYAEERIKRMLGR